MVVRWQYGKQWWDYTQQETTLEVQKCLLYYLIYGNLPQQAVPYLGATGDKILGTLTAEPT